MQAGLLIICLVLALISTGSVRTQPGAAENDPLLERLRAEGVELARAGRYAEAGRLFEEGRRQALAAGNRAYEIRFLGNRANYFLATYQYHAAIKTYIEAKKLAEELGDYSLSRRLYANLSSLYFQMGDVEAALSAAEAALAMPGPVGFSDRLQLESQVARVQVYQGKRAEAAATLRNLTRRAADLGETSLQIQALEAVALEALLSGWTDFASAAVAEAKSLRSGQGQARPGAGAHFLWGLSAARDGRLEEALTEVTRAVRLSRQEGSLGLPDAILLRSQVQLERGAAGEALADAREAVELGRRLRLEVSPAGDAFRVNLENRVLEAGYAQWLRAAYANYRATGREQYIAEMFEAAEENRAASLSAWLANPSDREQRFPAEYFELLARLREAEIGSIRESGKATAREARAIELRLREIELERGFDGFLPGEPRQEQASGLRERIQASLRPDEALLSFHLGDARSYLWSVTRERLEVYTLPAAAQLRGQIEAFRQALEGRSAAAAELGKQLRASLFGGLHPDVESRERWLVALDKELFELPLAALVYGEQEGRPVYLVERHSLSVVPNVKLLAERKTVNPGGGLLAVGDPVYNTADPRWMAAAPAGRGGRWLAGLMGSGEARDRERFQLNRLAGSGREIRECVREWRASGRPAWLLEGAGAAYDRILAGLEQEPAVLHLATHVVQSGQPKEQGLIALSLTGEGQIEFVNPEQIYWLRTRMRDRVALVVLSGCSSGQAEALPATGLMGMTRAWLAGGAYAVTASHWPTPDDSGIFFREFYSDLAAADAHSGLRPDRALRNAQLAMLRSNSFRAAPAFWAAFFVVAQS